MGFGARQWCTLAMMPGAKSSTHQSVGQTTAAPAYPRIEIAALPKLAVVRQQFSDAKPVDIEGVVTNGLERLRLRPGARIAIAVGSRGVTDAPRAVFALVASLKKHGALPFIVPAMGSHGGATAQGQAQVLADYGISETSCGAPVVASMDVTPLGETRDGVKVYVSTDALKADGIIAVNRVKPHTALAAPYGSGLVKMLAVGLGKPQGAACVHRAAARLGLERVIPDVGHFIIERAPILGGLALVENARHQTETAAFLLGAEIAKRELELGAQARASMARLPFDEIDFLIVDRMGKNISGTGMDPNVIGRAISGYDARLSETPPHKPIIRRIFVRDLTPQTHGNASGIGMADFTTKRLWSDYDARASMANALTSTSVQSIKLPPAFANDKQALCAGLSTCCLPDPSQAKVVRILDTLNLETLEVSEALLRAQGRRDRLQDELKANPRTRTRLTIQTPARPPLFDDADNLLPLGADPISAS